MTTYPTSRYSIHELNDSEIAFWDDWVSFNFTGSIYYKMGWLRAMEQNSGMDLKLFAVWPENGEFPLALFPLYMLKKLTLNAAFSPPPGCDTPYLGPLYNNKLLENKNKLIVPEIQSAMIYHFHKIGINFMKFRTFPGQSDYRGFLWKGFHVQPQYEYEFAINDTEEQLFRFFPGDTRTKIRRAQKYEDLIFEFGGIENAIAVHNMVLERFSEQGINWPVKESFIRNIFKEFHPTNIQVVLARFKGEPITGLIFFKHNNALVDWIGGISPRQNISGLNELMHWKIIEWGQKNDCAVYNLGGANTPHLCKPKLKYNPDLVLYSEVYKGNGLSEFINRTAKFPIVRNFLHKIK